MYNSDLGLGFKMSVEVGSGASVRNKCENEYSFTVHLGYNVMKGTEYFVSL